jgi:hypothetical protein
MVSRYFNRSNMALFSDSDIVTTATLVQIDGETASVATAEGITLAGTGGIIRQSWTEAKNEILRAQQLYNTWYGASSLAGSGSWAVLSSSYTAASVSRVKPAQIVISSAYADDASAFATWFAYVALANFYRSAANRKIKDRYDAKYSRYKCEAARMWGTLRANGLPVVFRPLECPGALHAVNAGAWGAANVTAVSGGASSAPVAYDVAITYVDQSQYQSATSKGNGESGPSATIAFTVGAAHFLSVSIAGLNPPNGVPDQVGIADGQVVPLNASGWNVYAAVSGSVPTLQNASPVAIATTSYTLAAAPTATGAALGTGQWPDRNLFFQRTLNRA